MIIRIHKANTISLGARVYDSRYDSSKTEGMTIRTVIRYWRNTAKNTRDFSRFPDDVTVLSVVIFDSMFLISRQS